PHMRPSSDSSLPESMPAPSPPPSTSTPSSRSNQPPPQLPVSSASEATPATTPTSPRQHGRCETNKGRTPGSQEQSPGQSSGSSLAGDAFAFHPLVDRAAGTHVQHQPLPSSSYFSAISDQGRHCPIQPHMTHTQRRTLGATHPLCQGT